MTAAVITLILSACVTTTDTGDTSPSLNNEGSALNRPVGVSRTLVARTAFRVMGSIPYDGFSIPLPSPDGQYIATQTGIAPTWSTALARDDAEVPTATRVEIYRFVDDASAPYFEHVATVTEPALLGRACNREGFLIESPREDGSRSIAMVNWQTGDHTWLVDDGAINAFATLGEDGRLAWSRRQIGEPNFELVIRRNDDEWSMPANGIDWLMPTWAETGDGLFVLRLIEGQLNVEYVSAMNPRALLQSRRSYPLARNANWYTAYQAVNPAPRILGVPRDVPDQFVFWHPGHVCMATWRPWGRSRGIMLLSDRSFAAEADTEDFALVATRDGLFRFSFASQRHIELLAGVTIIPRRIDDEAWPYLLLSPEGPGTMTVTGLKLLPSDPVRRTSRR